MKSFSFFLLLMLAGCGREAANEVPYSAGLFDGGATRAPEANEPAQGAVSKSVEAASGEHSGPDPLQATQTIERKMIYTANVELVVEDFSNSPDAVEKLVAEYGGTVADSNVSSQSGAPQSGHWKIRIPVARFDEFVQNVRSLGEVTRVEKHGREVTDEYYDVQRWIENKQVQRERLLAILADEKRVGRLKDVLEIEREVARVQGEIDGLQGRMNMLENLTALTTIDLNIHQVKDYVPPEAAGFATLAGRSFGGSWTALRTTGQTLALGGIALVPWLPVMLVAGVLARLGFRRLRRRNTSNEGGASAVA